MPRRSFFDEFKKHYLTPECKEGRHGDCDEEVILSDGIESPIKKKPCDCICHEEVPSGPKVAITQRKE